MDRKNFSRGLWAAPANSLLEVGQARATNRLLRRHDRWRNPDSLRRGMVLEELSFSGRASAATRAPPPSRRPQPLPAPNYGTPHTPGRTSSCSARTAFWNSCVRSRCRPQNKTRLIPVVCQTLNQRSLAGSQLVERWRERSPPQRSQSERRCCLCRQVGRQQPFDECS